MAREQGLNATWMGIYTGMMHIDIYIYVHIYIYLAINICRYFQATKYLPNKFPVPFPKVLSGKQ